MLFMMRRSNRLRVIDSARSTRDCAHGVIPWCYSANMTSLYYSRFAPNAAVRSSRSTLPATPWCPVP